MECKNIRFLVKLRHTYYEYISVKIVLMQIKIAIQLLNWI